MIEPDRHRSHLPALEELREQFLDVARHEAGGPRSARRGYVAASLTIVALLAMTAVVLASQNGDTRAVPSFAQVDRLLEPVSALGFSAREKQYSTMGELVDESRLVVRGTVAEVRSGGEIADIDPEYPTRLIDAVIKVEEVMKGSSELPQVTIRSIDLAFARPPGAPASEPNLEWRKLDQRILVFLAPSPTGGSALVPTNYGQSVYRVRGGKAVPLYEPPAAAARRSHSRAIALSKVRRAVRAAARN